MRTSSMLTRQISFRARRLWRAQTNPYAAQNLARASVSARAKHLCARPSEASAKTSRKNLDAVCHLGPSVDLL